MAATYDSLPLNVSSLFEDFVSTVATNLGYEINYRKETWTELCARLNNDDTSKPLIALIENFSEQIRPDDPYIHVNGVSLVIAKKSEAGLKSEERITRNFTPWLWPMYAEFMEVLSKSRYLAGPHRPHPPHKFVKSYNLGESDQNNTGMKLPGSWDAIVIMDLNIRVIREVTAKFCYGKAARLMYQNNVVDIEVAVSGSRLSVTITDENYSSLIASGIQTHHIYFGHNNTTVACAYGEQVDVNLAGVPAGIYHGRAISRDSLCDASLAFFYCINSQGVIYKYTVQNHFALYQFDVTGLKNPYYPVSVEAMAIANMACFKSLELKHDYVEETLKSTFETPKTETGYLQGVFNNQRTSLLAVQQVLEIDSAGNTSFQLEESYAYYQIQIL